MNKLAKLKDVASLTVGFVGNMTKEYVNSGIVFFRSLNIKPFYIDTKELLHISHEFNEKIKKSKLKEGDVVIVRTGQPGACCVIPKEYDGCNCSDLVIVRPNKEKVNPYFLEAYINFMTQKQINNHQVGAIQKHFNVASAKEMILYLPELPIQKKCAKIVNIINNKIKVNNKINAELESMAKTIYDYWFLQFEFPNEDGRPYKSSGGKMVWNEELKKEIPEGWKEGCFSELIEIGNGKEHKELCDGDIPVYGSGGIMRTVDTPIYNGESVLIPRKGTLNNIIYVNGAFWTVDTMFYSKMRRKYSAIYTYYSLKLYDFERLNTGTGVPSMTSSIIYNLRTVIPPDTILKGFDNYVHTFYKKIREKEIENKELVSLREFLLPLLMNGQVGFTD